MIKNLVDSQQDYTFKIRESFLEISAASSTVGKIVALAKFVFFIPVNLFYDAKHLLDKLLGNDLEQVHIMNMNNLHAASSSIKDKILNVLGVSKDFGKKHQTKIIMTGLVGLAALGFYKYPSLQQIFTRKPEEGYLPHILEASTGLIIGGLIIGGQTLANKRMNKNLAETEKPVKNVVTQSETLAEPTSPLVLEVTTSTGCGSSQVAECGLIDLTFLNSSEKVEEDCDSTNADLTPGEDDSFQAYAQLYGGLQTSPILAEDPHGSVDISEQESTRSMYSSLAEIRRQSAGVAEEQTVDAADFASLLSRYAELSGPNS